MRKKIIILALLLLFAIPVFAEAIIIRIDSNQCLRFQSPNETWWCLTVDDSGSISIEAE